MFRSDNQVNQTLLLLILEKNMMEFIKNLEKIVYCNAENLIFTKKNVYKRSYLSLFSIILKWKKKYRAILPKKKNPWLK